MAKVVLKKLARFHEVMIMQVTPLIVSKIFIGTPAKKLKSKQTLIRLLVTAIEQFLTSISRYKGLFKFGYSSESVL